MMHDISQFCQSAHATITTEIAALQHLLPRIDNDFAKACLLILNCRGRVVVTGMGKSGHIGHKIAATLASTGTAAFFVHPGEACHGDLGMILPQDVVIALSNSGETAELLTILPMIKHLGIPLISLTGQEKSTLAQSADVNLNISVEKEACPLNLAPTSSTTATLVMGDALAIALLQARGFSSEDFARAHPGGSLGQRLILRIDDVMRTGDQIPVVAPETKLSAALVEITKKRLGMTVVVNEQQQVVGIFTDGDLRRTFDKGLDVRDALIKEVMTTQCKTVQKGLLAAEALRMMENYKITSLVVLDDQQKLAGVLHMHDVLEKGMFR